MALNSNDQNAISRLLRSDIETTALGLRRFIRNERWIGKTNRYAGDLINRLKSEPPNDNTRKRNLAQYIVASAILHAHDGWSYLGRAVSCLMVGDAHRALHLGYYAELRAAMSLLAGVGVGIFNRKHFVVNAAHQTAALQNPEGTHQVAWMALQHWSMQPSSGDLFARLIRPEGITLDQWFGPLGGARTLAAQARDWFMQWGMDLHLTDNDRDARNESSYRPDGIPLCWSISPSDVLDFTRDLWAALEPNDQSSFDQIDRFILRLAVEKHYTGKSGSEPAPTDPSFVSMITAVVSAQGLSPAAEQRWEDFLLRRIMPVDPLIFDNSSQTPAGQASDPIAVLSRAVLLLRLATGSAHDLLKQARFDSSALTFWWNSVGVARGLWDPALPPAQLCDLWVDIREALDDIDTTIVNNPAAFLSISGLRNGLSVELNKLCSHERVGLWGLCPT